LRSAPATDRSDTDILGAAGFAAKRHPMALALLRLLSGDNRAGREIVDLMAAMLDGKAYRSGVSMSRMQAKDIAQAVLAWSRDGACKPCGGLGYLMIDGAPSLSDQQCPACKGTGKRPFDSEFSREHLGMARWLLAEMEREMAKAGPAAMAALAPRLDL
jgi:hypothetical protein